MEGGSYCGPSVLLYQVLHLIIYLPQYPAQDFWYSFEPRSLPFPSTQTHTSSTLVLPCSKDQTLISALQDRAQDPFIQLSCVLYSLTPDTVTPDVRAKTKQLTYGE